MSNFLILCTGLLYKIMRYIITQIMSTQYMPICVLERKDTRTSNVKP